MPKDDYDVVVFKILTYLYACLKRKITFDERTFDEAICRNCIHDMYFSDIIRMMKKDGYIENVTITRAWGNDYIISSQLEDMRITSAGIDYLKENSKMNKIKDILLQNSGIIGTLISMIF